VLASLSADALVRSAHDSLTNLNLRVESPKLTGPVCVLRRERIKRAREGLLGWIETTAAYHRPQMTNKLLLFASILALPILLSLSF